MKSRSLPAWLAAAAGLVLAAPASAATIHVPADYTDLQLAINASSPGDLILVAAGTYPLTTTVSVNVANLTIQGAGAGSTVFQVASAVGDAIDIPPAGAGATIRDLSIEKTDLPGAPHNLIWVYANNVTIENNAIYGPDPGTPWSANGIVSRAMVVSPGVTGLLVTNNDIHHLRQPGYFSGTNGVPSGTISNNHVSGTRGWVIEGGQWAITGNTWGPPENQGAEIALLGSASPADYPPLLALSAANNDAYISAQWAGGENGRGIAYVNAAAAPGGLGSAAGPYTSVQAGVDNALAGGAVQVAAGTYTEQVVVNGKNLAITGAGAGATVVKSPASLATSFTTSAANFPVVLLENAADIRLAGVTVDGDGQGAANYRFMGVAFWNAGGKLLNCDVVRVRDTPFNGSQHGNAVYAYNNTGGPFAIEVGNCTVSDFQKNGITMNGTGLTADVHGCTVTGQGPTTVTAQNGIQVAFGAGATLTANAVSGIGYTGTNNAVASGLLLYGPGAATTVSGGSVTNSQMGCYVGDVDANVSGLSISTNFVQGVGAGTYPAYGYGVYSFSTSMPNAVAGAAGTPGAGHPLASPVEDAALSPRVKPLSVNAAVGVTISGGCVTGSDQPNSEGIEMWSAGGPLSVAVTGVEVSDWDYGLLADGSGLAVDANHNAITSNVTAGYYGFAGPVHDASPNWWGAANGPSGDGPGTGDAVTAGVGATIAWSPWLVSGADSNPGCGFVAASDNAVTPGPAPSCISAANTCITIPVSIARTTSEGLRGFSVTLQLSSNLVLCSGTSSVVEGNYLSDVGTTTFQVVPNGGGSYTVDGAILGTPCGATAATGTLFTLDLKKAPGPDGPGTVTVGTVLLRDCDNAAVAATAGAPLSITIDTGGPAAIANLAATQKKTGNDADGTTKIQLNFTAPGDAAVVEVYRAPYGQYPEYDDAGGAPPAVPSYPPAGPWTLTPVTASGQYDEVATRDFWYFVAFTKDGCGNVSAVSNMTTGTLNYHLGDVSNGVTPGAGNNLVNTADISLLGAHYGITLAPADPYNYLDVGPTTDFSVNARPTTDNKVGFEDLMMFAINYATVSAPQMRPVPVAAGSDALGLGEIAASAVGETFTVPVTMSGAGDVQGASLAFAYDARVVEFVSAEAGPLLGAQAHANVVLSPSAGVVDFALLGEGAGLSGEGTVVEVTFRRTAAGDPAIALAGVTARDGENHPVSFAGVKPNAPATTALGSPYPNPFRGRSSLRLSIAHDGPAKVAVYDLVGRRIRTLLDGVQTAGEQTLVWDGRDDGGRPVPAGLYLVRFAANGVEQSRRLVLMQ